MALISFSVQVIGNDEDFDNSLEEMPSYPCEDFLYHYSGYIETIFLSGIHFEEGAIEESYPAQLT